MLDNLVRLGHQPQRLTTMAPLPPGLLAALAAQALGLARQPVTAGRFAAGVAIFGQPRFPLLHALQQQLDPFAQHGVLGFQAVDLFLRRHASTVHLLRKSV